MNLLNIKFTSLLLAAALFVSTAGMATHARQDNPSAETEEQTAEQTIAAEANALVSVCVESGNITVHGWDRNEVHARSTDAGRIELRRMGASSANGPASRLVVLMSDSDDEEHAMPRGDCSASGNVELDIPRGATIKLRTRSGDIHVADVSEAHIDTLSGDISVRHAANGIEASSVSGDLTLSDSDGRVRAHSISGEVSATNMRPVRESDEFVAKSVSGDVRLEQVGHTRVEAGTVSGDVSLTGPLARGGVYDFKTTNGDVTLTLPGDSSFRINAVVAESGSIAISGFPIKETGTPGNNSARRVTGVYGTGDATLNLSSFSGTLYLRRK